MLNLQVVLPNGDVLYTGGKGGRAKLILFLYSAQFHCALIQEVISWL